MNRKCAICQKPADPAIGAFCSIRCQQVDLHRWLGEVYTVPGSEGLAPSEPADNEE